MRQRHLAHRAGLRISLGAVACTCVLLLLASRHTIAGAVETVKFTTAGVPFVAYLQPLNYLDAVAACANQLEPPGATLTPIDVVPSVFAELEATQPDTAKLLVENIYTTTAIQTPRDQNQWNLWTWDQYRSCRGLNYYFGSPSIVPNKFFLTSDRPCYWTLLYICMPESAALASGLTSASSWYRQHFAPGAPAAPAPSPYALGPAASGLALVRSNRVYGDHSPPPNLTVAFDNSADFWGTGPVVSAFYRAASFKLMSLSLLREGGNRSLVWAAYRNNSLINDVIGADGASANRFLYEVYHVGPFNDYVVAVQGCYRAAEVEMLYLITRTGRQYQMGRGGCTYWFREDAPPGGYLAGLAGAYMNPSLWPRSPATGQSVTEVVWINQVQLVWAATDSAARPTTYGTPASPPPPPSSLAPAPSPSWEASGGSCPTAPPLARVLYGSGTPGACGGDTGSVCPSNTCCGAFWQLPQSSTSFWVCNTTTQACQTNCQRGFGLCSTLPDRPVLQFVRSPPPLQQEQQPFASPSPGNDSGGGSVYLVKNDGLALTYPEAQAYCRRSYMGMSWSLVNATDVLGWYTSMDTRRAAYAGIAGLGYFWVAVPEVASQRNICSRAGFAVSNGPSDTLLHTFVPSTACNGTTAMVVCKRAAADSAGSTLVAATTATDAGALRWTQGPHNLTTSRSLGGGPYGTKPCSFSIGAAAGSGSLTSSPSITFVESPLTVIAIASAAQLSNDTDPVAVVAGLRLVPSTMAAAPPPPLPFGSPIAGSASASVWSSLVLDGSAGEVVTAVSGCVGGYVERLVLHTSAGRVWTHAFGAASLCTAPFEERAPTGSYLVGMQGYIGDYVESLRLVWGQPSSAPGPSPPPVVLDSPPSGAPSGLASPDSHSNNSRTVGIAVGVSLGGAAALALAALLAAALWRRRRRHGGDGTAAAGGGDKAEYVAAPAAAASGGSAHDGGAGGAGVSAQVDAKAAVVAAAAAVADAGASDETPTLEVVLGSAGADCGSSQEGGKGSAVVGSARDPATTTTPSASCGEMSSSSPITGTNVGSTSQADIEKSLSAYGRSRAGAEARAGGDSSAGRTGDKTRTDMATAISLLQEELCGRQEQLHVASLLGKGSFGVVYRGSWRGLQVAVKELLVHEALLGKEGRQRQQAILEAAISKSMQHPNVVVTYATEVVQLAAANTPASSGAGKAPTAGAATKAAVIDASPSDQAVPAAVGHTLGEVYKLYIIQEYCDFGSLCAALSGGAVGSVTAGGAAALCALTLALDVACGMSHIHTKNIVHGDLSASNVLLASCRRADNGVPEQAYAGAATSQTLQALSGLWRPPVVAKVSDFGLSVRMSESQTHASNRFQGTPAYTAPEVRERGHLSKAADVWAFGVLLLELCHGVSIAQPLHHHPAAGAAGHAADAAAPGWSPAVDPDLAGWVAVLSSASASSSASGSSSGHQRLAQLTAPGPRRLLELMGACLAMDPKSRPGFEEVVDVVSRVLLEEHHRTALATLAPITAVTVAGQPQQQSPHIAATAAPGAPAPAVLHGH